MLLHPWITLALGERDTNSDSLCLVVHATNISTQHRSVLAILIDRFVRDQITCLLTPTSGRGRSLGQMIGAGAAAKCWMNVRARDCEWTYFTKSPSRRRHGGEFETKNGWENFITKKCFREGEQSQRWGFYYGGKWPKFWGKIVVWEEYVWLLWPENYAKDKSLSFSPLKRGKK